MLQPHKMLGPQSLHLLDGEKNVFNQTHWLYDLVQGVRPQFAFMFVQTHTGTIKTEYQQRTVEGKKPLTDKPLLKLRSFSS